MLALIFEILGLLNEMLILGAVWTLLLPRNIELIFALIIGVYLKIWIQTTLNTIFVWHLNLSVCLLN